MRMIPKSKQPIKISLKRKRVAECLRDLSEFWGCSMQEIVSNLIIEAHSQLNRQKLREENQRRRDQLRQIGIPLADFNKKLTNILTNGEIDRKRALVDLEREYSIKFLDNSLEITETKEAPKEEDQIEFHQEDRSLFDF